MILNIKKSYAIIAIVVSMFTIGCLKDKRFDNGEIQADHSYGNIPKIIEIKINSATTSNVNSFTLNASDADTLVNLVPVNLATNDPATEDIHVTVAQNDQLVNNYNNDPNNTNTPIIIPSSNVVSIVNPGGIVVIPKGQHTGYLQIKTKPNPILGKNYGLGFTITNVAEKGYVISGNAQNGIATLVVKNQYDGIYVTQGYFVHPNPSLAGSWTYADDVEQPLKTMGPNSVGSNSTIVSAGELSVPLSITVNADNTLSILLNGTPTPSDPNNKYDPSTKSFHIVGGYRGGSRHLEETLKFLKPRP